MTYNLKYKICLRIILKYEGKYVPCVCKLPKNLSLTINEMHLYHNLLPLVFFLS